MTRTKNQARGWVANIAMVGLTIILLLPVVYMISTSLRSATDIAAAPLGLPTTIEWGNYSAAIESMNYPRAVLNSTVITLATVVVTAMLGSMAAFALYMRAGKVARISVMIVALAMATPNFVLITPIYVMFREVGLLNSYLGMIIAYTALNLPLAIFFYLGFIGTVPKELLEAARVDKCTDWQIYSRILLPLLMPATATVSLFVMLFVWNDFTYPLLLLSDSDMQTVTISVYRWVGNQNVRPEQLFPAAVLASIPLLVLFAVFQRKIVAGIASGSVK